MARIANALMISSVFGWLASCGVPGVDPADTVYLNAAVYTMTSTMPHASAVAIRRGEIAFVGTDAGARSHIGDSTEVVDLGGRMLMPGFHDTHAHVLAGGTSLADCTLGDERDVEIIRARLRECLATRDYGDNDWVLGSRWPLAAFPDGNPRKEWLDEVFGNRPAFFSDSFGHSAWVSSRALEIAGIDDGTPNPPQGVIERDPATGDATGTLRDSAMELVGMHIPEASDAELAQSLLRGLAEVRRYGITAYIEPGLDERQARLYAQTDRDGELTARVIGSLSPIGWHSSGVSQQALFDLLASRDAFRTPNFRPDSVKIYIDGVIETETSFMLEPYSDGGNFAPFYEREALLPLYARLHEAGLQIHTHAIGDAAIRLALDAYEYAQDRVGPLDNRHHIVHLQLIDEQDIPRFGALGVAASFQGLWAYPDDYIEIAKPLLGKQRVQRFYPVASVQRTGGMIVGGSDWDVSSLNPLDAIETLVRRRNPFADAGPVLGSNEEISLDTALAAYTINAAHVMGMEKLSGTIEAGKRADLIVLDRDLFAIPPTEINEAQVLQTILDGRVVNGVGPR